MPAKKLSRKRIKNTRKRTKKGGMMPGMGMGRGGRAARGKIESDPDKCEPARLNKGSSSARRGARFLCAKYCSQKPTACGGKDENGVPFPPEEVCVKLNVCPQKESLYDVPKTIMKLVNDFQVIIKKFTIGAEKKKKPKKGK